MSTAGVESSLIDEPRPGPRSSAGGPPRSMKWSDRRLPAALRAGSHGLVWSMAVVPMLIEVSEGWQPTRDDAMISIGAYQVFSAKFPLVGVWSQASEGLRHAFYGLGPLQFWMLAVPVHLDPTRGALWGSALVCACALSLAIEAAWSIRGWPAAAIVALVAADLGWQTELLAHLDWNPFFGLVFLEAAVATAWAVAAGRPGWWPVTVFLASVSAQSHLVYAVPAVVVALGAPAIALIEGHRPASRRWMAAGLTVGVVCWAPPLVQQVATDPGNISVLLASSGGHHAGPVFGLHALSMAVGPRPIWLTGFPYLTSFSGQMPRLLRSHSPGWAVAGLVVVVAVAAAAWRARRRELSALAGLAFLLAGGVALSFGVFPQRNLAPAGYLAVVLWLVGTMVWVVLLWAGAEAVAGRSRRLEPSPSTGGTTWRGRGRWTPIAGLLLVAVCAVLALRTLVPVAPLQVADKRLDLAVDRAVIGGVVRSLRPGPVALLVRPSTFTVPPTRRRPSLGVYTADYWGIALPLLERGWEPALPDAFYGPAAHLTVPAGGRVPTVLAHVDPATLGVTGVVYRPPPTTSVRPRTG